MYAHCIYDILYLRVRVTTCKVYDVILRAPVLIRRQRTKMAAKSRTRIGLIITNSQHVYICEYIFFVSTMCVAPFVDIFSSFLFFYQLPTHYVKYLR